MVLAMAAEILPDALLHNLTTIFTFMGEGLLLRDDQFSFQVIESSIQTLVPILVRGNRNNAEVVAVVQVFVDILPDIPLHRRLRVFKLLTEALHPEEHLWLVNLLIIKSFVTRDRPLRSHVDKMPGFRTEVRRPREMPMEVSFALQLIAESTVQQQIMAARNILSLLTSVPTSIGATYEPNWKCSNIRALVLGLPALSAKQIRHFLYVSVGFLFHLFSSENFIAAVATVSYRDSEMDELLEAYEDLLTSSSFYLNTVVALQVDTRNEDAIASKFWQSLQGKVIELQDSVCSLLPPQTMLNVTSRLLSSPLLPVRIKSLELLRSRLMPSAAFFNAEHSALLAQLLPRLTSIASDKTATDVCRQVALGALQLLLRHLSSCLDVSHVGQIVVEAVKLLEEKSQLLVMQSLLVIAECVSIMKNECLPVLPKLLPTLLTYIVLSTTDTANDHLLLSAIAALYKVVECVPHFLSPWVEQLIVRICRVASQCSNKESSFSSKINSLAVLVVKRIQPRVLLPVFPEAYRQLTSSNMLEHVRGLLEMVEQVISHFDRKLLVTMQHHFMEVLKESFAARHNYHKTETSDNIEAVEATTVSTILRLVLKQDEEANLKMISNLLQWADSLGSAHSRVSLYRVLDELARTLKVLFIKSGLADHTFNHAITTITNSNNSCDKLLKKSSSKPGACLELKYVLSFVSQLFEHDTVGFASDSRFEQCIEPFVDHICNTTGGIAAYTLRIREQLQPCLLNLCSASRNDALWADLNRQMLMLLRQVRHLN